MCMRDGHQWDWYQPIGKANANGDYGGHHLHGPRDRAVIGLESQNGVCGCHGDCVLQFSEKKVGVAGM